MGWQLYCAFSMMIDLIIYLKLVLLKHCIKNCKKKYIVIINIAKILLWNYCTYSGDSCK